MRQRDQTEDSRLYGSPSPFRTRRMPGALPQSERSLESSGAVAMRCRIERMSERARLRPGRKLFGL